VSPYAIVIEPTRELTLQVWEQGRKLADGGLLFINAMTLLTSFYLGTGVVVGKTYGRTNFHFSMKDLERDGTDILCTTMGRLWHLVEKKLVSLHCVNVFTC
jgi:superfamily II DNA/RNA helicase